MRVIDRVLNYLDKKIDKSYFTPRPRNPDVWITETLVIKKGESSGMVAIPCAVFADVCVVSGSVYEGNYGDRGIAPKPELLEEQRLLKEDSEEAREKLKAVREGEKGKKEWKTCPSYSITLPEPAKHDLFIPVRFGVEKKEIKSALRSCLFQSVGTFFLLLFALVFLSVTQGALLGVLISVFLLPVFGFEALISFRIWQRLRRWWNSMRDR